LTDRKYFTKRSEERFFYEGKLAKTQLNEKKLSAEKKNKLSREGFCAGKENQTVYQPGQHRDSSDFHT
jgi:hypothetical protein